MQLIYRGHFYTYTAIPAKSVIQPRVINWRYRLPGAAQMEMLPVKPTKSTRSSQPRAINWRYQVSKEV